MNPTRRQFLVSTVAVGAAGGAAYRARWPARPFARHVVLVGDSIFDNGVYVPGKPSVSEQLGAELGEAGKATLLARDGDVTADVKDQLESLPEDATHLVVSVGGNDALGHVDLLDKDLENSRELLAELATIHTGFRAAYANMLATVVARGKSTAVCTIYDSNYDAPKKQLADVALSVFNDAILRCAIDVGVPVVDLRRIFTARHDYANPIEPSEIGGAKLVRAILEMAEAHDFATRRTTIYG